MSSGNCGDSTSVIDVPITVGVTGVTVLTVIGVSGNSNEEEEVYEAMDSVRQDRFDWIGVASGGKGGLLTVLHK